MGVLSYRLALALFPAIVFIHPPQTDPVPENNWNHHCNPAPVIDKEDGFDDVDVKE